MQYTRVFIVWTAAIIAVSLRLALFIIVEYIIATGLISWNTGIIIIARTTML